MSEVDLDELRRQLGKIQAGLRRLTKQVGVIEIYLQLEG